LGFRIPQSLSDGVEDIGVRWSGILALPQTTFQRQVLLVAFCEERGDEDAGGASDASASLGRQP
jgi:hypothetical protein